MFCTRCGTNSPEGAMFCSGCGEALPRGGAIEKGSGEIAVPVLVGPGTAVPVPVSPSPVSPAPGGAAYGMPPPGYYPPGPAPVQYGGFWLRVVAYFVDTLVLAPLGLIGFAIMGGTVLANLAKLTSGGEPDPELIMSLIGAYALTMVVAVAGNWLYHALMESSRHEGTLGKKAMGLRVTDLNGNRLSFGRASGRFFGKIITGMTMGIGFAMAGFTERRQCLHDMIAGTLVVKK